MHRALRLLLPLLSPLLLTGCISTAATVAGETGISLAENRSLGRKMDDNVIYADILNRYVQSDFDNLVVNVTVSVRFGRVLLTGSVPTQEVAGKAVAKAWQARGVLEVINELAIAPKQDMAAAANDILVKKNLQGRLLITKDVWTINYAIDVVDGTAYMLGRTHDRAEMNRALNVARTTKGVKRVVNYLQVSAELPDPTLSPDPTPPTSGPPGDHAMDPYQAPTPVDEKPLAPHDVR
jgi:osmotically-inducible protein OsmY